MKIVLVPVKMFEPGDAVNTPDGPATVIQDNLDTFNKKFEDTEICSEAMPSEEDAEHAERCNEVRVKFLSDITLNNATYKKVSTTYINRRWLDIRSI